MEKSSVEAVVGALNEAGVRREAVPMELAPGLSATFVNYEGLLRLKNQAGRPQDLEDVARLKAVREGPSGE